MGIGGKPNLPVSMADDDDPAYASPTTNPTLKKNSGTKPTNSGLRKSGKYKGKSNKTGGGGRFQQVEDKAKASGAKNPAAVAAAIGNAKYGKGRMQSMAKAGRERAK
jgi:hypothetical protein